MVIFSRYILFAGKKTEGDEWDGKEVCWFHVWKFFSGREILGKLAEAWKSGNDICQVGQGENTISELPDLIQRLGEKVAFGVLTGLHLTDASPEEIATVYSFCEEIGLPTTFADLGIREMTWEKLMKAATKACAPAKGIHHEAGQITPGKVVQAMIAADEMGRRRGSWRE